MRDFSLLLPLVSPANLAAFSHLAFTGWTQKSRENADDQEPGEMDNKGGPVRLGTAFFHGHRGFVERPETMSKQSVGVSFG